MKQMDVYKMNEYELIKKELLGKQYVWLITGVAGFIGSNLLEQLLKLNQKVVGLDNFSTGYKKNIDEVKNLVTKEQWLNFKIIKGDIRNINDCKKAMYYQSTMNNKNNKIPVDYVLHQAALGSVPRSIKDPILTNQNNIDGFLNIMIASRDAKVKSFTYAASSSTYGDSKSLPKKENKIGKPLSSYAVTKYVNELYAYVFKINYDFNSIGLRYFNVYGPRQDPNGAYAAVIPLWIDSILNGKQIYINGDGKNSRDFTYIDNVVQANILAATTQKKNSKNEIYNIACGKNITLDNLNIKIRKKISEKLKIKNKTNIYRENRIGDVKKSKADILKAKKLLKYDPNIEIEKGLEKTVAWFLKNDKKY